MVILCPFPIFLILIIFRAWFMGMDSHIGGQRYEGIIEKQTFCRKKLIIFNFRYPGAFGAVEN